MSAKSVQPAGPGPRLDCQPSDPVRLRSWRNPSPSRESRPSCPDDKPVGELRMEADRKIDLDVAEQSARRGQNIPARHSRPSRRTPRAAPRRATSTRHRAHARRCRGARRADDRSSMAAGNRSRTASAIRISVLPPTRCGGFRRFRRRRSDPAQANRRGKSGDNGLR